MNEKEKKILELIKKADERVYQIELYFFEDSHSGDFREVVNYDNMTPEQVATEVLNYFLNKDLVVLHKITRPETTEKYDFEKENYKACPVCGKIIDYHTHGFYHDEILNIWICGHHKLEEILKAVELKDKDTIAFIKAEEEGKQIFYYK